MLQVGGGEPVSMFIDGHYARLSFGEWMHLAVVLEQGRATFVLNGRAVSQHAAPWPPDVSCANGTEHSNWVGFTSGASLVGRTRSSMCGQLAELLVLDGVAADDALLAALVGRGWSLFTAGDWAEAAAVARSAGGASVTPLQQPPLGRSARFPATGLNASHGALRLRPESALPPAGGVTPTGESPAYLSLLSWGGAEVPSGPLGEVSAALALHTMDAPRHSALVIGRRMREETGSVVDYGALLFYAPFDDRFYIMVCWADPSVDGGFGDSAGAPRHVAAEFRGGWRSEVPEPSVGPRAATVVSGHPCLPARSARK